MEYIALIHKNADSTPTAQEWERFFELAGQSGMFQGGSEIGRRIAVGSKAVSDTTHDVGGYMRFVSDDLDPL